MTRLGPAGPRPYRGLLLPSDQPRRAPPSPPAQDSTTFEFVHKVGSEMCAAEDVFLRGQLRPFKPPPPAISPSASPSPAQPAIPKRGAEYRRGRTEGHQGRGHRRAESLDAYERGAPGAASRYWQTKGSHSADYQRLLPVAEESPCDARPGPRPASAGPAPPSLRPKWYVLLFGSVKVPAETDMKSIKSRLRRRSSDGLRADSPVNAKTAASGGAAWKLLRSLSCKGDVAGAVDAPLRSYGLA